MLYIYDWFNLILTLWRRFSVSFRYPSGILPVFFRRAGKYAMWSRNSVAAIVACFRQPSGILPAAFRYPSGVLTKLSICKSTQHQDRKMLVGFRYPLGGWVGIEMSVVTCNVSVRHDPPRLCYRSHATKYRRSLTAIVVSFRLPSGILPVSFRRAGESACLKFNMRQNRI